MLSCKSVLTVCSYRAQSNEICSYGRVPRGSLPWVRRHGSCTYRQSNTTIAILTLDIVEQRNYGTVFSTTDNANWSGFLVQSFLCDDSINNAQSNPLPPLWRHNEHDVVSNHQYLDRLLNRCFFGRRSRKTSKLPVNGLCEGNSPVTGEFPAQRASNVENISIWWRHHGFWLNRHWFLQ